MQISLFYLFRGANFNQISVKFGLGVENINIYINIFYHWIIELVTLFLLNLAEFRVECFILFIILEISFSFLQNLFASIQSRNITCIICIICIINVHLPLQQYPISFQVWDWEYLPGSCKIIVSLCLSKFY